MAQIVDVYGNPIRTQQLREPQTSRLAGLAKEFAQHPAKGLTPAKLARILVEAEQGNLQAQAELFMDMEERDAHLFAEMSKRKRAILGLDWAVEPPRNASAAEKADADYLHELLLDLEGLEGYVARSGLFRVLAWPYLFRHYATSDLAEMLEIYGLPIRLGKYPPGTADEEKATLLRAVTGLGHAAAGIIPETMAIDFQQAAQGSSEPFLAMMRQSEDAISKAVLGGTLTSTTSQSGGGAFALGQVHNEVRHDLLASDARQLAATLSRDLLWPLLVLNRPGSPDVRRAPRLVFDLREQADITNMAQSIPALVNVGLEIPSAWVYDKLGIPQPAKNEPVLRSAAQPAILSRQHGQRVAALATIVGPRYGDQQALDKALADLPAKDMQNQANDLLAPLLEAVNRGDSETELLGALAEAFPDMDDSALTDALHRLLFAADTWGRLHGNLDRID